MNKAEEALNSKRTIILATALVLVLLLSMAAIPTSFAADTAELYLASSAVSSGFEWNVTAWVRDIPVANPAFAYQVAMLFNTSFIECTQATIPKWDDTWIFSESHTISPTPMIDNANGFAVAGDSILIGESTTGSGPFLLALFRFHIKSQLKDDPTSYIRISLPDTVLIDNTLKEEPLIIRASCSTSSVWSHTSAEEMVDSLYSGLSNASLGTTRFLDEYLSLEGSIELIVGLKQNRQDAFSELASSIDGYGGEITNTISMGGKVIAAVINITKGQVTLFESRIKDAGFSTYIEPNHEVRACMEPNDTYWQSEQQWGPEKIEANWAWNTTLGNSSILVAIIDSGVDYNHTDLTDNYAFDEYGDPIGYDWVNDDSDPMDDCGHGTHCAGIIAATINNGEGIAGLAQVRIMAEKVLNAKGGGTDDDIASGIIHATEAGAKIISMSLGGYWYSQAVYNACRIASEDYGVLLIAAAGNEDISGTSYPAYFREVIAVSATNETDTPASFSNFGPWIELAAPGVRILSTISETHRPQRQWPYSYLSGTSMACPHVAGVAALIWSQFPNLTRDQVRVHLRKTADDLGAPGFDIKYGWGRVDARNAVEQSVPEHDLLILNWTRTPCTRLGNIGANATIVNYGANDENNVVVQLWRNGSMVDSETIDTLSSGSSTTVELMCSAPGEGTYNITVCVVPVPYETDATDNAKWAYVGTEQRTIRVPGNYQTIQEAIDAASPGDTIQVSAGIYNESVYIPADKCNVSLIGDSRETTVINGSSPIDGIWPVHAEADNLRISRFTLQNSGHWVDSEGKEYAVFAGIQFRLFSSYNCTITDNTICNNVFGIVFGSDGHTITGNRMIGNNAVSSPGGDGGICGAELNACRTVISENSIESFGIGIYLGALLGIHGLSIITNNTIKDCDEGMSLWTDTHVLVEGNKIVDNNWTGIGLDSYLDECIFRSNYLGDNTHGLYVYGHWEQPGHDDNMFYWNSFVNNTIQVYELGNLKIWHGLWNVTGNYWSDYTGSNWTGYKIGVSPYIIDGLWNVDNFPFMKPYLPGDVRHDGKVDIFDVVIVAAAYNSTGPPDPSQNWNPHADLTEDNEVNDADLAILYANYGKTWQTYWGE